MDIKKCSMLVATIIVASSLSPSFNVEAASGPSYFKCSSGYSFKINRARSGVRCEKRTGDAIKPISCPSITVLGVSAGTFPYTKSGKDKCGARGLIPGSEHFHNPLRCPRGYVYKTNYSGKKDRCVKPGKLKIAPPSVKFR